MYKFKLKQSRLTLPEWPKQYCDDYLQQSVWNDDTFDQKIREVAEKFKDKIALNYAEESRSYIQLYQRAYLLASQLQASGLHKGDIVILHLPNSINYVETLFALLIVGIVPVFALPAHRENEIFAFVRAVKAKAYIYQSEMDGTSLQVLADKMANDLPDVKQLCVTAGEYLFDSLQAAQAAPQTVIAHHPDDLACFQLSGGTTGTPKLIPRRHRDYLCNIRAAIAACAFGPETVYLAVLPMGHNFTLACPGFMGTLLSGGRVVISDKNDPDCCFALIEQEQVTVTALVPPLAMVWLDAAEIGQPTLNSLQTLQVGGARMSYEAAKRVLPLLGCTLQQVFGMAEGLVCFTLPDDSLEHTLMTQGKPMTAQDEIRVVNESGAEVNPGETGYLLTRGPYTIRGYYGPPDINRASFDENGFYRSGDLVRLTHDGYLISEGRDKDQINRGGEKIDCGEMEDIFLRHPGIKDAAVVGIHDDYLGERSCAFLLCEHPAPDIRELRAFLINQGVASFKIPDRFHFPSAFDLTGVGKISKKALRVKLKQDYLHNQEGN